MVQTKSETSVLCDKEILYHGFLCFTAIAVIVTQATILNFYIIAFFRGNDHHVSEIFIELLIKFIIVRQLFYVLQFCVNQ